MAAPPKGEFSSPQRLTIDNTTFFGANRLCFFVTNHGNFGRDLGGVIGLDYGTWYPYTGNFQDLLDNVNNLQDKTPNYASGLWVGGIIQATGDTNVVISEYASEFVPGPMLDGTFQSDRPAFQNFKLHVDSLKNNPNADYTRYMTDGVAQGAPTMIDGEGDLVPDMIGDEMIWCVYNDASGDDHDQMTTDPLGIEVKQTLFGFSRQGSLGNMAFARYQIFNKGGNTIENMYISLWCDPDLGTSADDLVGCDTLLGLGFVYNDGNPDTKYQPDPVPAMGFDFFQGPLVETGNPDDTGRMWGELYPGFTNLGMVSFNKYINGTDPDDYLETYYYMQGWDAKARAPYDYPAGSGNNLLYQHSGDPVTGQGDLDPASADKRWMQTTGPITFSPGDSTEILAAIIVSQGTDALSSLTSVKNLDNFAQRLYENGFNPPDPPARPQITVTRLSGEVSLSWTDTSEVDPGDFEFEGYTVWQGPGPSGPWTEVATWDVDNDKTNGLIDTLIDPVSGTEQPATIRGIVNSGLAYNYTFTEDMLTQQPFNDQSPYYFQVSAFSFAFIDDVIDSIWILDTVWAQDSTLVDSTFEVDSFANEDPADSVGVDTSIDTTFDTTDVGPPPVVDTVVDTTLTNIYDPDSIFDTTWTFIYDVFQKDPPEILEGGYWQIIGDFVDVEGNVVPKGDRFLESANNVTVVPQSPLAGTHYNIESGEVIPVVHTSGGSDGVVTPTVIDPGALTGDSYEVTFEDDGDGGFVWHLDNTTTNTRLLENQTNQTGDDAYFVVDGMYITVTGPAAPGVLDWDIPFGTRRFTWANSDGFHWEGFNGAIGWGGPGDTHGFGSADPVPPADHVNVRLILAKDLTKDSAEPEYDESYHWSVRAFADDDPNLSYGYRYLRGPGAPAQPEFAPYIDLGAPGGSYGFQAFEKNVPLSAWNIDVDPPVRLIVGFLENNAALATLDGFWYPRPHSDFGEGGDAAGSSATDGGGPREWLWISTDTYSETPVASYQLNAIDDQMNWFTWLTVSRRGETHFTSEGAASGTDAFDIIYAKINSAADVFNFSTADYVATFTETASDLDDIQVVPNPFYLSGDYDPAPGDYVMKFHRLPETCTISIYSLSGKLVEVIEKDDNSTNSAEWDMLTSNGLPVGSGIYIYVVDAPGFGQKIGKVAVFVEQEVLRIY
jgi:hypothetical protein